MHEEPLCQVWFVCSNHETDEPVARKRQKINAYKRERTLAMPRRRWAISIKTDVME